MRLLPAFALILSFAAGVAGAEPLPAQRPAAPDFRIPAPIAILPVPPDLRDGGPKHRPDVTDRRCTADGTQCIRSGSYVADVCALIQSAAQEAGIDDGFLARLLWKESRFDATAVSPVDAKGIAQFMPGTAQLRGLEDPFNPAQSIVASADYLADLSQEFGNLGLAAVAYNGGEARAAGFIAGGAALLPAETQDYVLAITGHSARDWRDDPPKDVDYRLDGATPFLPACRKLAGTRDVHAFRDKAPPWGAVVAEAARPGTAQIFADKAKARNAGVLGQAVLRIVRADMPGFGRRARYTVQVPAPSRSDALAICRRLQAKGQFCVVKRN